MIRPDRTIKSIAAGYLGLILALSPAAPAASWVGRPLAEALNALRSTGFSVIYSSELVPDSLRVSVEPHPGEAPEVARQLLEPFGLGLKNVAPGIFAVVRTGPVAAAPPAPAAPSSPPPAATPLEQVIVAASRYTLSSDGGAHHLESGDIADQPKYADDPLRVVARLPGVTTNGVSARLNIRGGDADEVLFLIDGFPIRQAFHVPAQQSPFSAFDSSLISGIDVYTGGFPLRFGERMSGVVDMGTIDPDQDPKHSLSASTVAIGARTAGLVCEPCSLDGLIAARTGKLDNLMDRLDTDVQSPTFSDSLAKLRWRPSDTTTITAESLWSQDDVALRDSARGEFAHLTQSRVLPVAARPATVH